MKITQFNYRQHAEQVEAWGAKHRFPLPSKDFLPETGILVEDIAAGFIYLSNSKISWIEWVFSNPEKSVEERREALDFLMDTLEKIGIAHGMKAIFSSAAVGAYKSILERNGYKETDSSMTHFVKPIGIEV